jgi:hypothetical protein
MNRLLKTALLALLIPFTSFGQEGENIPSPAGMWCQYCKPKETVVGSVRTILFVEKREETPFGTVVETYAQGRRVESLAHSSSREVHSGQIVRLDSKTVYIFDGKGRPIKEVRYSLEKPGESWDAVKYRYSDDGRLVEEAVFSGNTPFLKTIFSYDLTKRTVVSLATSYYNGRAIPPFKAVLVYDEKGRWIKKSMFRADGSADGIAEFSYNEKGNLAKETRFGDDGAYSYAHMFSYKYDSKDNWIERLDTYTQIDQVTSKPTSEPWMMMYRVISYFEEK